MLYFVPIRLREVSQICDDSFTRGQPLISVTGQWRILSYVPVGQMIRDSLLLDIDSRQQVISIIHNCVRLGDIQLL